MYKIIFFPKIQVDIVVSYFILKTFGESKFPGISTADVEFWTDLPANTDPYELEAKNHILVDLGNGRFDHHRLGPENKKYSAAHLIAQYLEVDDLPELHKMLEIARRDDLLGKGTISVDPLDRSFGLPGLLMSLVKTYKNDPKYVLDSVMPLIEAHYNQEYQKYQSLPQEYQEALATGHAEEFSAVQLGRNLKIILINSDNLALTGYVRSRAIGGDLIIQRNSTNHVNFISNQKSNVKIHELAKRIKLLEAEANNLSLMVDSLDELLLPGRTEGLPHWYYDTRANTLQNGGMNPGDVPPTKLTNDEIKTAVKTALNISRESLAKPVGNSSYPNRKPDSNKSNNRNNNSNYNTRYTRGAVIID